MRVPHRTSRLYFPISVLLHVALLLVLSLGKWGSKSVEPDAWEQQKENNPVFELIDVPDDVRQEKPDAATRLVSDRSAKAADMNPRDMEAAKEPYADGDLRFAAYERPEATEKQTDPRSPSQAGIQSEIKGDLAWTRSIDFLEEMKTDPQSRGSRRSTSKSNLLSSAENRGGLSFNVYNWDFAPYMLAMKREVESHLFPPYAFTHMGAVSGTNVVRFTVMPDGEVRDLVVLASDAHSSLDLTSLRAIEMSLPFMPLPSNFPEDHLEVTAHFSYVRGR
ncbi:MAG: energy transducer TonB [Candidatus Eisenbacteria bacterium]